MADNPFLPPPPPPVAPRPRKQHPSHAMHVSELPVFPSSIPPPLAIAPSALPAHLQPRRPLAPTSPNVASTHLLAGAPSSATKPAPSSSSSSRPKKSASVSKARATIKPEDDPGYDSPSSAAAGGAFPDGAPQLDANGAPLFLAPDYTLNPAGPASSASTDFKCPQCDKVYRGKHARSIWRRHLQDKHGIPLSQQPRRTRWDNDANRPKSEEEKRARTLDSKRRWARKNRATKNGSGSAGQEPSVAGSVGTPASDDEFQQQQSYAGYGAAAGGEGDESADADSSFDATSVAGWSTEGAAAMNGLAGRSGSAGPAAAQQAGNPFYPYAPPAPPQTVVRKASHLDVAAAAAGGYAAGGGAGRHPSMRSAGSMPPGGYADDPRYAQAQDGHHLSHYSNSHSHYAGGGHSPSGTPGNASPFHPSSANPYSHPFSLPTLPPLGAGSGGAVEQPHYAPGGQPQPSLYDHHHPQHHPSARYDSHPPPSTLPHPHPHRPHDSLHPNPLNPLLAAPQTLRRPASNPNPALHPHPHPHHGAYDAPPPGGVILAGQPAPVARDYYGRLGAARGASPARVGGAAAGGLESPVKLGGGRAKPTSLTGAAVSLANGGSGANGSASASAGAAGANGKEHPREDAAGILLALKAGPSSPMGLSPAHSHSHLHAAVQSPVSNLRDRDTGDEDDDGEDERATEGDDEDEEHAEAEVRALMGVGAGAAGGALSRYQQQAHQHPQPSHSHSQQQQMRGGLIGAGGVPLVSPQKRRRSASPASFHHHHPHHSQRPPPPQHSAPMMASSSSSGGEGGSSTAAAHALLATAKKAHSTSSSSHPAGWSHASLTATPTPGGLMQSMMESSPAVRFGAGGGANGGGNGGAGESDGDGLGEDDDEGEAGHLRGVADEPFTSSSGGRHRRRRSESPSSGRRRGGAAASSSGASSSSQPQRGLHHHHPVGLTSELGDLDFHQSSSSSGGGPGGRMHPHHHHDPLRDVDAGAMPPPPPSAQAASAAAHLKTPAPAPRNGSAPAAVHDPSLLSSAARPSPHHHDPFLAHPTPSTGAGASGIPPASAAAIRTSSPPFGTYTGFLFSSPAHPQFSKTLGLASLPGPGVLSYTLGSSGVGGDTPAAATGKVARERQISAGSAVSLDGVLARSGVLETPVRGGGGGGGGGMALETDDEFEQHSRRDSVEEDEEDGDLGDDGRYEEDEDDEEEVESPERLSGSRRESTQEEEEE
ncbi:hypothetical protein JCM6882_006608 [Rhodosporidiobolus microsporus]